MTPDQYTIKETFLEVGNGHQLYVHDWGNASAETAILVLHGGPGNGCDDRNKKNFDPIKQRVIFHDQRGSGKSLPTGLLKHNTTPKLVEDIETISQQLGLEQFVLLGGSWGSTLALAYGIAFPRRVKAMVLNGVFTGAKDETNWLDQGGWREFFPDVWDEYRASVPQDQKHNPTAYHLKRALGDNDEAAKSSAYAYQKMELALLKLDDIFAAENYDTYDPAAIKIEMHFLANNFFLSENEILNSAASLTMPIWLIQGRYDMVCRPAAAYRLHKALPNCQLVWTINGHLRQHEATTIQNLILEQLLGVK